MTDICASKVIYVLASSQLIGFLQHQ